MVLPLFFQQFNNLLRNFIPIQWRNMIKNIISTTVNTLKILTTWNNHGVKINNSLFSHRKELHKHMFLGVFSVVALFTHGGIFVYYLIKYVFSFFYSTFSWISNFQALTLWKLRLEAKYFIITELPYNRNENVYPQ
jgi:hypothetical protein